MNTTASNSPTWISPLARCGYAAKGVVYLIIGWLALKVAFGEGGSLEGSSDALAMVRSQPFGQGLLFIMGVGLAAYSIFRLLGAFVDAENEGEDGEGMAKRAGYFGSGLAYGALAIAAFTGLSGGGGDGEKEATATALSWPGGQWIVGLVGLAIIFAGIFQWVKAMKEKYKTKFTLDSYAASKRAWINRLAKLGLIARGVVFPIIGFFLMKAAIQSDPSEAKGLGDALRELASGTGGQWVLGIVTLGLACYGIYCWVLTIYGNFGRSTARA